MSALKQFKKKANTLIPQIDALLRQQGLDKFQMQAFGYIRAVYKIDVAFLLACFARGGVTKIRHICLYAYIFAPCHEQTRCAKFTTSIL